MGATTVMRRRCGKSRKRGEEGVSLIETLLALSLMGMLILGVTAVFMTAVRAGLSSRQLTEETVLAQEKMEELLAIDFDSLTAGGNLDTSVTGFNDSIDADSNGVDDYFRRWQVVDDIPIAGTKMLRVRVVAAQQALGPLKTFNLAYTRRDSFK